MAECKIHRRSADQPFTTIHARWNGLSRGLLAGSDRENAFAAVHNRRSNWSLDILLIPSFSLDCHVGGKSRAGLCSMEQKNKSSWR